MLWCPRDSYPVSPNSLLPRKCPTNVGSPRPKTNKFTWGVMLANILWAPHCLKGLLNLCWSCFKDLRFLHAKYIILGFQSFLVMVVLNLCFSFNNNIKSVRMLDVIFFLMPISKYSRWSVNAKWMQNNYFCHLIWVWLALCLWLTFSSLLVQAANILWILDSWSHVYVYFP